MNVSRKASIFMRWYDLEKVLAITCDMATKSLASVRDQLAYFVTRTMQSQKENPLLYFMAKKRDMTNLSSRLQEIFH